MELQITSIKDFPSKQAEVIQKHLLELDKQGKLKEEFLKRYKDNLGDKNSFARFCLDNWEEKKDTFINWTGIEVYKDKHTIIDTGIKMNQISYGSHKCMLWKCSTCQYEWVIKIK